MSPLRPHLDVVVLIQREAVVDALWDDNQVSLVAQDPNPAVLQVPHVKVTWDGSEAAARNS